jgi:hypothetical protein
MSPQTIEPLKVETVRRPNLPLPRHILDALKKRSDELGLKPSGGAVQAIEAWIEATKDKVIFPG